MTEYLPTVSVNFRMPIERVTYDTILTQRDMPFFGDDAGQVNAFHLVLLRIGNGAITKNQVNANLPEPMARAPEARSVAFRVMALSMIRRMYYPLYAGAGIWGAAR